MCLCFHLVGVNFNQSSYTVNERSQQVQPELLLSRPLSVSITVQVIDTASTAISKNIISIHVICIKLVLINCVQNYVCVTTYIFCEGI